MGSAAAASSAVRFPKRTPIKSGSCVTRSRAARQPGVRTRARLPPPAHWSKRPSSACHWSTPPDATTDALADVEIRPRSELCLRISTRKVRRLPDLYMVADRILILSGCPVILLELHFNRRFSRHHV